MALGIRFKDFKSKESDVGIDAQDEVPESCFQPSVIQRKLF